MRLATLTAALILVSTCVAGSQEYRGSVVSALNVPQALVDHNRPIPVHSSWTFVGCIPSHHACGHHAQDHGYHHHTVQHSHDLCPVHPHLACLGRN